MCVCVCVKQATNPSSQDGQGRVSYEQSGEFFFLPFSIDDILNGAKLRTGDEVNFYIATDKR